jgi:hypothetical protein
MNGLISWPVARATARERGFTPRTFFWALVLVLLGSIRNTKDAWGAEAFSSFAGFWFFLLVLILGGGLLSDEVESGHAQLVLLRPITRSQWVSGRFAGAAIVLCTCGTLGWAASAVAAVLRGEAGDLPARLLVLPLALLPALGWLATATALSAVVRGWTNAGLLIGARAAWLLSSGFAVPAFFPRLLPIATAAAPYAGPQDAVALAWQAQGHDQLLFSPALWDLFWLFAAWTVAVSLFNRRELARRR